MTKQIDSADLHARFCGNQHPAVAAVVFGLCSIRLALIALLPPGTHAPGRDSVTLLGQVWALVILAYLFRHFKCPDERFLLAVLAFQVGLAFVAFLAPSLVSSSAYVFRLANLASWIAAAITSLRMVISSVRAAG